MTTSTLPQPTQPLPFQLNPTGTHVVLLDDDWDPAYHLPVGQALALADYLHEHRAEIEAVARRQQVADAFRLLPSLLNRDDLPQPKNITAYPSYDGFRDVEVQVADQTALEAWLAAAGGDPTALDTYSHPSLGRRLSGTVGALRIETEWIKDEATSAPVETAEPVPA